MDKINQQVQERRKLMMLSDPISRIIPKMAVPTFAFFDQFHLLSGTSEQTTTGLSFTH